MEEDNNSDSKRRDGFLMAMYAQMWNNINRHITVVWQAVGALTGAFAIFALVEKQTVSGDVAASLLLVVATWLLGHVYDANTWFNRNLGIIANIERQFLTAIDAEQIHFYFAEPHRKAGSLLHNLRIQRDFGFTIAFVVLCVHFVYRVLPGLSSPWSNFELNRALPYMVAVVCLLWLWNVRREQTRIQGEFAQKSPGIQPQPQQASTKD